MIDKELTYRVVVGFVILVIMSVPFLGPLAFPKFRHWIKEGIEGDNERLDADEIAIMMKFFVTGLCTALLGFMIFTIFAFDTRYPWELMLYTFLVILQADGNKIISIIHRRIGRKSGADG